MNRYRGSKTDNYALEAGRREKMEDYRALSGLHVAGDAIIVGASYNGFGEARFFFQPLVFENLIKTGIAYAFLSSTRRMIQLYP